MLQGNRVINTSVANFGRKIRGRRAIAPSFPAEEVWFGRKS